VSTIKVDTYLTRGGVSEIAIDKLKGASSASSISVVGEGGSTTTNLQHGLAKAHTVTNQTNHSTISAMSLNISGYTDNGTGRTEIAFSNNFSSAAYTVAALSKDGSGYNDVATIANSAGTYTTSAFEVFCCHSASDGSGSANDSNGAMTAYFGDLA